MATAANEQSDQVPKDSNDNGRRNQVMVGDLPNTFLRVPTTEEIQDQMVKDSELARRIAQEEMSGYRQVRQPTRVVYTDRLFISVVEARLNKNYGMTRMDPFCCIRVNHTVYETETCHNGAKNPTWSRPISVMVSEPVDTVYLEIYDEGTISGNTKVAWTKITLPDSVKNGDTLDDWWPLSGGLGDEKEGKVHIIFSQKKYQQQLPAYNVTPNFPQLPPGTVTTTAAAAAGLPVQQQPPVQPPPPSQPPAPIYTEEDIKQIKDLFPSNDEEVIKTVLEASRGNKNAAIDILLNMQ